MVRFSFICLIAAVCLAVPAAPAGAADFPVRYQQGEQALRDGDYKRAYTIFSELLWERPEDDDVNFNLGLAAYAVEEYPHALFAFERVLMNNPDADRVRLEIGRTYIAMGQLERAREEFQKVLAHDPPAGVRATVEELVAQIDQATKPWSVSGSLISGYYYDDNVNSGLGSRTVTLNDVTYTLDDASLAQGDNGAVVQASLSYEYRLDEAGVWYFVADGSHYQTMNKDMEDDDLTYSLINAGIQWSSDPHVVIFLGKYEDIDYDYHGLVNIYGIEPLYAYVINDEFQLHTELTVEHRDYRTLTDQSGNYYAGEEKLRWFVGEDKHILDFSVAYFNERAGLEEYSNHGYTFGCNAQCYLPYDLTLTANLAYQTTQYHDPATSAAGDLDRKDRELSYGASLSKELDIFDIEGLSLGYSCQVTDNNSNTDIYDYDRIVHTGTVTCSF